MHLHNVTVSNWGGASARARGDGWHLVALERIRVCAYRVCVYPNASGERRMFSSNLLVEFEQEECHHEDSKNQKYHCQGERREGIADLVGSH